MIDACEAPREGQAREGEAPAEPDATAGRTHEPGQCVLALDLGTSAVKAGVVCDGDLVATPTEAQCPLTYGREVTLDPNALMRSVFRALSGAVAAANARGWRPTALAVVSQAQTCVRVGQSGAPKGPLVSWLSVGDKPLARRLTGLFPDYAQRTGFCLPSELQLAAKIGRCDPGGRVLLINEYVIMRLTGQPYGDTTLQGMGGLYDIRERRWWPEMLDALGLVPEALATIGPAGSICIPLTAAVADRIGTDRIPVLSCGLDQSASAIGAGVGAHANMMCNFGTAMVVYAQSGGAPTPDGADEIAGIDPLTDRYFLLGLENECGNVLAGLAQMLYAGRVGDLIRSGSAASSGPPGLGAGPVLRPGRGGRFSLVGLTPATTRDQVARAALDHFATACDRLIRRIAGKAGVEPRLVVGGGLSRSGDWLEHVAKATGLELAAPMTEHPGLIGAAVIARAALARDRRVEGEGAT